jgi:peroxiredoxin family protein
MADREKVAFIVNTAAYERVAFGLAAALAEASLGKEVCALFSYGGLIRLKRDIIDEIGHETDPWLKQPMESAVAKGGVARISDSLKELHELGAKIYACPAAMVVHNISREELVDEVDGVRGVVGFLAQEAKGASIIYI